MKKSKEVSDELEMSALLEKCGRQCQREFRLGRSSSFGHCQEKHLQPSARAERKGRAQGPSATIDGQNQSDKENVLSMVRENADG